MRGHERCVRVTQLGSVRVIGGLPAFVRLVVARRSAIVGLHLALVLDVLTNLRQQCADDDADLIGQDEETLRTASTSKAKSV
jgi:hypothetical protein